MGKFLSYLFAQLMANAFLGWLTRRGGQTMTPSPPSIGIAPPPNQPPSLSGGGAATSLLLTDIEFIDGPAAGPPPATNLLDDIELSDT